MLSTRRLSLFRHLAASNLALLILVRTAAALLPCANPAADPCVISSTATIPVGTYDIRPRSLDIKNKTITVAGPGTLTIEATNIIFEAGARVIANDVNGGDSVVLAADGTFTMQSTGTSKSKIDVSGVFGGGTITVTAARTSRSTER